MQEALSLVEPLIEDPVGYVRQAALIAMALIMIVMEVMMKTLQI